MENKVFDSELQILQQLWENGEMTAKELVSALHTAVGWNKNTTYTVIKKCVAKGLVERIEPNFTCRALVSREQVQAEELDTLINRMFDGSAEKLFSALLDHKTVPPHILDQLREQVDESEDQP